MSFPRQPGVPSGFMSDIPPPALAAASFTPPGGDGFPVGGLVFDVTCSLVTSDPGTDPIGFRWLECTGQEELTATYPLLSARIGNTWNAAFGAPSAGHFRLPNLRKRFPISNDGGGSYLTGTIGGEETHVLTAAEMPLHDHGTQTVTSTTGGAAGANNMAVLNGNPAIGLRTQAIGGGGAHNNMPLHVVMTAYVRALP